MKRLTVSCLLLLLIAITSYAQDDALFSKGNKVFVESKSKNENAIKTRKELQLRLQEWGHWKLVESAGAADFKLSMETAASKGITATSWGGTSYVLVAKLVDKAGEVVWESNAYKASPNGTNGFNAGRAVVKKLMRDLKKKFEG